MPDLTDKIAVIFQNPLNCTYDCEEYFCKQDECNEYQCVNYGSALCLKWKCKTRECIEPFCLKYSSDQKFCLEYDLTSEK